MQPAEVDVRGTVEGAFADQVQGAAERDVSGNLGHLLARGGVENDDVVEPAVARHLLDQGSVAGRVQPTGHPHLGAGVQGLADSVLQLRREAGQHHPGRAPQRCAEVVPAAVSGVADDPRGSAVQRPKAASLRVGGLDAGPRLRQCRSRVADAVVNGDHVGTVIGGQHLRADEVVLDQAAPDGVAVGGRASVHVYVGLDGQPVSAAVGRLEVVTDLDDGDRDLMAQTDRVDREVAAVELGMVATEPYQLHIGVAQAHRVDAH